MTLRRIRDRLDHAAREAAPASPEPTPEAMALREADMTSLEDEIRSALVDHEKPLCARRVAEIVTWRTGARFGGCGPETSDVERTLRAMPDVEEDEDAYTDDDGEAYRGRSAATLLQPPSAATLADLAERAGWAIEGHRCLRRAGVSRDVAGLSRAAAVGLLHELAGALDDSANGASRGGALAWAYEVREGATDARLEAGVGWCRDLAASLRVEVDRG